MTKTQDESVHEISFEYIQSYYKVPAVMGRRVTVYGKPGIIVADRGHYIGVNFDEDEPGVIKNCHPTCCVIYEDMGSIRKVTRSKRRYLAYLAVAESFNGFGHFLRSEVAK